MKWKEEEEEMKEFTYSDIEAATEGFALKRLIGKGSHGRVYKGVLRGNSRIAVKKASQGLQSIGDNWKLDNEIDVLKSIHSPHLVNLIGVCHNTTTTHKLLVMEFMPNGSLHDLLHVSSKPPTWFRRMLMSVQIAKAIRSLHESMPLIIHRDIKSANILLDSCWNAKLADFSLAVRDNCLNSDNHPHSGQSPVNPAGTIGYLDPCYIGPENLSPKNDIFSFGVVLLELISCRKVMDFTRSPTSIVEWALPLIEEDQLVEVCDSRVSMSYGTERAISRALRLAARCVSPEKGRRPFIGEVVEVLESVMGQLRLPFWNLMRNKLPKSIHLCLNAWKMRTKTRVTTTKIVCQNHFIDNEEVHRQ